MSSNTMQHLHESDGDDCECDGDSYYDCGTEICKKCGFPTIAEYERRGDGWCYKGMGRWYNDLRKKVDGK